jgi:hypothetical protein
VGHKASCQVVRGWRASSTRSPLTKKQRSMKRHPVASHLLSTRLERGLEGQMTQGIAALRVGAMCRQGDGAILPTRFWVEAVLARHGERNIRFDERL